MPAVHRIQNNLITSPGGCAINAWCSLASTPPAWRRKACLLPQLHSLKHQSDTPHPVRFLHLTRSGERAVGTEEQPFPSCSLGLVQAADHSSKTFLFLPVGQNAAYSWHVGEGSYLTIQASWKLRVLVTTENFHDYCLYQQCLLIHLIPRRGV